MKDSITQEIEEIIIPIKPIKINNFVEEIYFKSINHFIFVYE